MSTPSWRDQFAFGTVQTLAQAPVSVQVRCSRTLRAMIADTVVAEGAPSTAAWLLGLVAERCAEVLDVDLRSIPEFAEPKAIRFVR